MKISLIICAYNEENYIGACLESVLKNGEGKLHEIIVVDNNSTDRTNEIASTFTGVTVVKELRQGTNQARQRGAEVATGDILAFIDSDTRIPVGWVDMISAEFENYPEVVCLTGPYAYYDLNKWQSVIASLIWQIFAYPAYLVVGYMANGGNFTIRRETLEKMGGLDTSVTFYGDDTATAREANKFGKVKFDLNFIANSSARRFLEQGIFNTLFKYMINFWSQVFAKKTITKSSYQEVR